MLRALTAVTAAIVIGHSSQGRSLRALEVGNPQSPHKVLVVGCIHGNECAGLRVIWLLAKSHPAFDLWLLPNLNPDGLVAGTRQNARGVDLNRNFPSSHRVMRPRGDPEYPGPRPFSEPESRALRSLVARVRPDVTIWFHQPQTLVRAWGPSLAAGRRFAREAGMRFRVLRWPAGSATGWLNRRRPSSISFVVELPAGPLGRALALRLVAAVLDQ